MPLYLGIDAGTQGLKALVYDSKSKRVVSKGSVSYNVKPSTVKGRAEQSPSLWIEGMHEAVAIAMRDGDVRARDVVGVGVSGQQHGLVALDANCQVIRDAKLWCDTEAALEAAAFSYALQFTVPAGFTAPKLIWMKRNERDMFDRIAHVLLPHDFINFHLTGRLCMECGDASGTGVFNTAQRSFDQDAMRLIDDKLPQCFPELIGHNEAVGRIKSDVAAALGVSEDAIVSAGSGDNMMSAIGSGAVRDGVFVASLGTSGTLFGKSATAVVDNGGCVAPFCDATGAWLPLLCTMNCTLAPEEVRAAFGMDHAQLTALAQQEPAGSRDVTMLPFLTGERSPNLPQAFGTFHGIRQGTFRAGVLYRAALEGATLSLAAGMRRMQQLNLPPVQELRVVGGGAKNTLWQQILADAFQLPVRVPLEPEAAALGAALQAAAVHQRADVATFASQHAPPLQDTTVQPNAAHQRAYAAALLTQLQLTSRLYRTAAPAFDLDDIRDMSMQDIDDHIAKSIQEAFAFQVSSMLGEDPANVVRDVLPAWS